MTTAEHDFDFLVGTWDVAQRRLKGPLTSSTVWEEFDSTQVCWQLLDGVGNLDEVRAPSVGLVGITLRLFDTDRQEWSLYWASKKFGGPLEPPVVGRFTDGVGRFYCDDTYDGTPIRVRYIWSDITPTSARWEQAFSTDGEKTWETNWTTLHTRRSE